MDLPRVSLRCEEIEDARKLSVSKKLALSGDLFDAACEVTLSGIRHENPGISDQDALNILRRRLEIARRLETRL
jgi:hypothetical protein